MYLGCFLFLYSLPKVCLLKKLQKKFWRVLKKETVCLSHKGEVVFSCGFQVSSYGISIRVNPLKETNMDNLPGSFIFFMCQDWKSKFSNRHPLPALCCLFFVFQDRISLCNSSVLELCIGQVGLELRDPPASLGIKGKHHHYTVQICIS